MAKIFNTDLNRFQAEKKSLPEPIAFLIIAACLALVLYLIFEPGGAWDANMDALMIGNRG